MPLWDRQQWLHHGLHAVIADAVRKQDIVVAALAVIELRLHPGLSAMWPPHLLAVAANGQDLTWLQPRVSGRAL